MRRRYLVLTVFHLFLVHAMPVKFGTDLVNRMKNNRKFELKYISCQGTLYGYIRVSFIKG